MAINFDQLPQENPNGLPDPGIYKAKIVDAEMRQGKDLSKPPYLNLKLSLFNKNNKGMGTMYDIISESDSPVVQYKVSRFIRACGIPLTGSMELKDLAKIVVGKEIVVDVTHDTPSDPKYKPKAQVDMFAREAYYLLSEFDEIYSLINPDEVEQPTLASLNSGDEDTPFDAQDGGAAARATEY